LNDGIKRRSSVCASGAKGCPHSKLVRACALKGGVSAQVTALELERPDGHTQKLLVRQHGEVDRQHNLHIARDEFRLLRLLRSLGLAVPTPYHFDESGEIFATPYIVLEYIEGQADFAPANLADYLSPFAAHLSMIHKIDASHLDLAFLPQQEKRYTDKLRARSAALDESLDEGRIRDALEAVWPLPQRNPSALLHGDYWPGNLLWENGQLVGIIDWEDAALGDPLADLGNSRLEILLFFGSDAMQQFTLHYEALMPIDFANLPYWDLCAALRPVGQIAQWGLDASTEKSMRERHRWFRNQAFASLPV
jgi:aminoglycoside phosphotransferase (APT) family kinase protein